MNNINMTTEASISKELFGDQYINVDFQDYLATVNVDYNKDGSVNFIYGKKDSAPEIKVLQPGDSLKFTHRVDITASRAIEKDHLFPINIEYLGHRYQLKKTKNGKLLLTK